MSKVQHTVTGCIPIDKSIIEAYTALKGLNDNVTQDEDSRQEAEGQGDYSDPSQYPNTRRAKEAARQAAETERERVSWEDHTRANSDHGIASDDHTTAVGDHRTAGYDHVTAVADHGTAGDDHTASEAATLRANTAAAAAEHMVDIHRGPGIETITEPVVSTVNGGTNTIRITTEDGKTFDFYVRNGKSSAGFFATSSALSTTIPSPNAGDYAFVSKAGDGTFPAYIYVCTTAGAWTATENEFTPDDPTDVLDVLNSTSTTAALSANQGKVLDGKISQLGQKVNGGFMCNEMQTFINSNGGYANGANDKSYIIPVSAGDTVVLSSNNSTSDYALYSLVSTYPVIGSAAAYISGTTRTLYRYGATFTVPENCYLVVTDAHSSDSELCKDIVINGSSIKAIGIDGVNERVDEVGQDLHEKFVEYPGYMGSADGRYASTSGFAFIVIPIVPGKTFKFTKAPNAVYNYVAFLNSFTGVPSTTFDINGTRYTLGTSTPITGDIPAGAKYIYSLKKSSTGGYIDLPTIEIDGVDITQPLEAEILRLAGNTETSLSSIDTRLANTETDVQEIAEDVGNVTTKETTVPNGAQTVGTIKGDVGSAATIGTSTSYFYYKFSVSAGEVYKVTTRVSNSTNYPYYVFFLNNDTDKTIVDRKIEKVASGTENKTETLTVPTGATRMWVMQIKNNAVINVAVKKLTKDSLQLQIDSLTQKEIYDNMLSDHDMFGLESDWWIKDRYLDAEFSEDEATALDSFKTKFRARAGSGVYQIAVISDTHGSGAYSWKNILRETPEVCHRSIAVFNKVVSYCDAAFHGGDISVDYGTSRYRILQYMYDVIRKFCFDKPFFITKGNHDENNNSFVEVGTLDLDWTNKTYYTRNYETFTPVTKSTWDGSPLFVSNQELVSDREFENAVQHWLSPSGANWGPGAYYYYDVESLNIRIIVANSFPVNDNHEVSESEEYLWLAQTALNFHSKTTPSDWKVIMLRHTQSTGLTALSNCINAFRNGNSWTYGDVTIDFGSSDVNGGGLTFMAHVHGHEHGNCFSNGSGYFDIGENAAFVLLSRLGQANRYGISVLSIDTNNSKIYEDTINGHTWCYNYSTGKLEIAVGETFVAAISGLSGATASSSNTSVATCEGRIITAVSAGNATITVSNGSDSYDYLITVV